MGTEGQAYAFLMMALCGAVCAAACDALALLRLLAQGGTLAQALCDLLSGAVLAAGMTVTGLHLRIDPFRLYAFGGAGAGFLLWQMTAGRLWRRAAAAIARLVCKASVRETGAPS